MDHTPPTPAEEAQVETPSVLPSILGDLRSARAKIGAGADPLEVVIPGYDEKLVVAFRWVPITELAATSKQLQRIKEATAMQVAAAADTLVATCDEVKVRVEGEVKPLSTNGIPITFSDGDRLSYALGFPKPKSARECCVATFNNEYAMIDVAFKVMEWLEDTSKRVDSEHLGE
ncbi:MAG: hypothetical protein ACXVXP_00465 [Mycobacteriaceae bacterium]